MCGIAGFADTDIARGRRASSDTAGRDSALLSAMCAAIRHRGPDDEGRRLMPGAALGMRRLSIIDLATGQQPIHNEDSTIWVVFNGEIYNYAELRADLSARGHRFYTQSDTETIVHAYEEWGQDAFKRLRGMFGIALWDARDSSLWLARDRVGIKPLHYAIAGDRLYFGSEIKSILATGALNRSIDFEALDH
jgi:asparagine synthase (glutamine-hydrolysing)